ncbi:hypothetical protein THASP1DRAFT_31361 [Thamnocephalis sphaerospora]|uniref:Uncharacterized protein n=1 Tax=Thamnocephalis sphaerospora TaxID=78915 RepID=A0A4P9XLW4_9FUNG|nr:hypothetical protein THASP1DRAFT_31361 [Thamnocephalis sphaerospora]|eukprot:RKP06822.1 hypothetical protein THASP1DRAFT_31361 [Thamnocephalis sphaerospora]
MSQSSTVKNTPRIIFDDYFDETSGKLSMPAAVLYAMGACFVVLAFVHMWRLSMVKSWPHATFAAGLLLDGVGAIAAASVPRASAYLGILAHFLYHCTLAVLILQWIKSMQNRFGGKVKVAKGMAYLVITMTVIWMVGAIVLLARLRMELFEDPSDARHASIVPMGFLVATTVIAFIVSLWMWLICPKAPEAVGCGEKRRQIGMVAVALLLLGAFIGIRYLNPTVITFVSTLVLGIITVVPVYTLSGHALSPGHLECYTKSELSS